MGHQGDLAEAFRSEVGVEFAFLVEDAGFPGPEQTDNGLLFHSAGLEVEVWFLDGHEPVVTTLVTPFASDGVRARGGMAGRVVRRERMWSRSRRSRLGPAPESHA